MVRLRFEFNVFRQCSVLLLCFVVEFIGTTQTNTTNGCVYVCVPACVRYMRFTSSNTQTQCKTVWSIVVYKMMVSMCLEPNNHCIYSHSHSYIHIHKLFSLILFYYRHSHIYLVQHETWIRWLRMAKRRRAKSKATTKAATVVSELKQTNPTGKLF